MKIRNGFVSNSSSCSFTIKNEHINMGQFYAINNIEEFINNWKRLGINLDDLDGTDIRYINDWNIHTNKTEVKFSTWQDNFNMIKFLNRIGITEDKIENYES